MAIDATGEVVANVALPTGWRLEADTPDGLVVHRHTTHSLGLLSGGGQVTVLDDDVAAFPLCASHGCLLVSNCAGSESLRLIDTSSGRAQAISHPGVAEWHTSGAFSPDGRHLAIGAYPEPDLRPPPSKRFDPDAKYVGRRSVMAVIDTATADVHVVEGDYDNFSWRPAWSSDSAWVVFLAPFQSRRLYALRKDDLVLHTFKFRKSPPAPMLDVTDCADRV